MCGIKRRENPGVPLKQSIFPVFSHLQFIAHFMGRACNVYSANYWASFTYLVGLKSD